MKKKTFISVAILATLSVFLAGCSGSHASDETPSETVSVTSGALEVVSTTDPDRILSRLIGWGEGMGLIYDNTLTPDTAGYDQTLTFDLARNNWSNEEIVVKMQEQFQKTIKTLTTLTPDWRGTKFCPVLIDNGDQTYTGYILYASVLNNIMESGSPAPSGKSDKAEETTSSSSEKKKEAKSNDGKNSKAGTGNTKGQSKTGNTASKSKKETTKAKSTQG